VPAFTWAFIFVGLITSVSALVWRYLDVATLRSGPKVTQGVSKAA
jgi:hypothetical protein